MRLYGETEYCPLCGKEIIVVSYKQYEELRKLDREPEEHSC